MIDAALDLYRDTFPGERLNIADLGCSSGPNAVLAISQIVDAVDEKRHQLGHDHIEFQCFLNDLPWNDFNAVFKALPEFCEKVEEEKGRDHSMCFIVGVPGSFYGRLFPKRSLHLIISSLSEGVHLNRGNLWISKTSPPCVFNSYLEQFQKDFSVFLMSRSEEIVIGGRMVLTLMGRKSKSPSDEAFGCTWELMARILMDMASEGLIEAEKIDSFNFPFYTPSLDELVELIKREGTFTINRLEFLQMGSRDYDIDHGRKGHDWVKVTRAALEPMLESHFGRDIMDDFFIRIEESFNESISPRRNAEVNPVLVSLVRKG
ncbi:Salicylate O-methyltransferase [Acorus gramineus]|uniref:Salicylate O-methyltransferase n=1 Tax=Acorus gramineus TaxID=55184 RepID=A0AAV9BRT9_ACOGR|nr:Salicylate O-methyltransferase [Acorus gramineus]